MQTGSTGATGKSVAGKRRSNEMEECMRNCVECAQVCLETIPQCLQAGGKHAAPDHIMMLINCARICGTSAEFLATGSKQHVYTCGACAEVCEECAEDCEKVGTEDFMKRCAEICKRCADSCRKMSAH
ncbi:MAG: hypothetical protein RL326_1843 [Pseudomonadota bacterium]|jgi:hypothetical protein